jgi:hypothetical protein
LYKTSAAGAPFSGNPGPFRLFSDQNLPIVFEVWRDFG